MIALIVAWISSLNVVMAQTEPSVSARLDRERLSLGESFTLLLQTQGSAQAADPDLTPLQEDFYVLGNSRQTSVQMSGGRTEQSSSLYITLEPKRSGTLTVPPITVGGQQTQALTIQVAESGLNGSQSDRDVLLEVDVLPAPGQPVYVQQQISLVVKLLYTEGLSQGNLEEPEIDQAVVQRLEAIDYTARRGSRSYKVIERRYAIQAERSGELEIPALHFSGRLAGRQRSIFSRNQGRRVQASSEPIRFQVKPVPAAFSGETWLPSQQMQIQIKPDDNEVRVGEPLTRTITLQALGLSHNQLPDLPEIELQGGRVYVDDSEGQSGREDRWLVSQRQFQQAILPTRSGKLDIPESRIAWWDINSDQEQHLIIPAMSINVLPALNDGPAPVESTADAPLAATETPPAAAADSLFWRWLSLALLILWLATLGLWWRERGRSPRQLTPSAPAPDLRRSRQALREACSANDAATARASLLDWGRALWPKSPPSNLAAIAARSQSSELRAAIDDLVRSSYSQSAADWSGAALWAAVDGYKPTSSRATQQTAASSALPPLYPRTPA
ncbi:MAG: BatD family protein [Wenzhouxiangellaceae bacterium]